MNNISPELTRIVALGKAEARRLGETEVRAEHLLLGLMRDDENHGSQLLFQLNVTPQNLERIATEQFGMDLSSAEEHVEGEPVLGEDSSRVFLLTNLEVRQQHTEEADGRHVVLAMLRDPVGNRAKALLNKCDVDYRKVTQLMREQSGATSANPFMSSYDDGNDYGSESGMERVNAGGPRNQETLEGKGDTPFINQYGRDLTEAAAAGAMDPLVGRHIELQRVTQILQRRKKNNPILVGDPGAGKSAIVEGLAQLIVEHRAGPSLEGRRVVALDMAQLVAGTQYRGQFEERLRRLVEELREHPEIILFIDEIHTIVGAGSAAGSLDAANMLKPALARGEIRCIGATTTAEYRKTIEKDGALERRFQQVRVEPTTEEETLDILRNIQSRYEAHHHVSYSDEAIKACVMLTERYITSRCLPDKAIDALDEAGAQAHIACIDAPRPVEDKRAEVAELRSVIKEAARREDYKTAAQLRDTLKEKEVELDRLTAEWQQTVAATQQRVITDDDIARVVSMMSHIPVQRMQEDERKMLRRLEETLSQKVIAQDKAVAQLTRAIQRSRLGLKDPKRPIGIFMFVGPTGVGKTHLAKTLAEEMFGTPDALIRIDMSEYGEKHTGARLVGAPPGYVGYEEGGQLTEKVRRRPYSIILLDEVEKAHQDVFNMLLQVMDEGRLTDGNGVTVDFRHTVIIMTSNSGSRQIKDFGAGVGFNAPETIDDKHISSVTRKALERQFAPEFLNRLDDIIMFHALDADAAARIVRLEMRYLLERLAESGHKVEVDDAVYTHIASKGFQSQYGARSLKRTIQEEVENALCNALIDLDGDSPRSINISVNDSKIGVSILPLD